MESETPENPIVEDPSPDRTLTPESDSLEEEPMEDLQYPSTPSPERTLPDDPFLQSWSVMDSEGLEKVPIEEPELPPSYCSPERTLATHDPYLFLEDLDPPPLAETPISYVFSPFSFGESKSSMIGAGLLNLGNTCFLNAILQCFTHTVPFVESLRSCDHPTPCDRSFEEFCVLCALRDHIDLCLSSAGRTVSPYKLVDNLSHVSSSFRRYDQEDAHEFLQCLLDKLDSCSVVISPKDQSSSEHEDSFVKKIYGGLLKSKLRCCSCGHCSDTFEPLVDLSLEIDDVDSLPSALKSFTKVEKIEETKFTCETCKEEVSVEKQFTLEQTPTVATFHLKRFKHDGSYAEKIDKYVEYPLELDLQPYSSNQESNVELKYELYAVVVHTGYSSCSGHYFCFIRSSPETWHKLDDSKITRVREEFVLSQEAYILFYKKHGTPWFSTLMETQKQCVTSPTSVLDDVEIMKETPKRFVTTSPKPVFDVVDIGNRAVKASGLSDNMSGVRDDIGKVHTAISLDKFSAELHKASEKVNDESQTPPRSPSPDLYSKDPPEDSYSIPRDHLRVKNKLPHEKSGNKELEDSKRKAAIRLTRTMPSSRAMKLQACMMGSQSEGAVNKKKRKLLGGELDREKSSTSGACRKLSPSILRSLSAFDSC